MDLDLRAILPLSLSALVGLFALCLADAWSVRRRRGSWLEALRLPAGLVLSSLVGSLLLAALRPLPALSLFGSFQEYLERWSGTLLFGAMSAGLFLLLPSLFLFLRRQGGHELTLLDHLIAVALILLFDITWMTRALLWEYPWGGIGVAVMGYAVLCLLRIGRARRASTPNLYRDRASPGPPESGKE